MDTKQIKFTAKNAVAKSKASWGKGWDKITQAAQFEGAVFEVVMGFSGVPGANITSEEMSAMIIIIREEIYT